MAGRCTNGHDTPGEPCMYCGAPLLPPPAPAAVYAPPPQYVIPPESGSMSALAIISFVLGLLFPIGSLPAIVVGVIALPRIRKRNQDGRGFAIAGIALGSLAAVMGLLAALVVFAVDGTVDEGGTDPPSSVSSPSELSSSSCRAEARTLQTASEAFYAQNTRYPLTMGELVDSGLLRQASEVYELRPNNQAMPDFVPIDGACGNITIEGN